MNSARVFLELVNLACWRRSVCTGRFVVGARDGVLVTSSRLDREGACPPSDVTAAACVVRLAVAVRPLAAFRLVTVSVELVDVNDHTPVFPARRHRLNVSEAAPVGASFSLPTADDPDAGVNGRVEYQLAPGGGAAFQLVQSVRVADGSTDVKLVLKSPLDRELVTATNVNRFSQLFNWQTQR